MKLSKLRQSLNGVLIKDPRFSCLHSDPRFRRMVKSRLKLPIDSRFRHMFTDKSFFDPVAVDKRGRPKSSSKRRSLHHYYREEGSEYGERTGRNLDDGSEDPFHPKDESRVASDAARNVSASKSEEGSGANVQEQSGDAEGKIAADTVKKAGGRRSLCSTSDEGTFDKGRELRAKEETENDQKQDGKELQKQTGIGSRLHDRNDSLDSDSDSDDDTKGAESSSTDSSDTESFSTTSGDESDEELGLPAEEEEDDIKVPVTEDETRRLALVNMDWGHIKAVDLLVIMNSFVPKGGRILSVSVYPSEFGLQQMKEDELHGPRGLFEAKEINRDDGDDEGDDELDMEKLRQYEKLKLRYFYAVVECDTNATADFLYKACDGLEFEHTSNTLDLRFIPDDMKFEHTPRDVAMEVPVDYEAPHFETRALQHSRVKLTWDDDEPVRVQALHRSFKAEELNEMDFKAYLASDDSEDEVPSDLSHWGAAEGGSETLPSAGKQVKGENKKDDLRNKYRSLLQGSEDTSPGKELESEKEMEITFHSGLDELSKRLMEKNKKEGETVWEAYLRKKKEKKREKKTSISNAENEADELQNLDDQVVSDDPFFVHNDDEFDDPFFTSMGGGSFQENGDSMIISSGSHNKTVQRASSVDKKDQFQRRVELQGKKVEEERTKAELELLLADDHGLEKDVKGYNLKKKLKRKSKDADMLQEKIPTVDYEDPRFSALFTSHHFAVDPTDPHFKRSAVQLQTLVEKQQKRLQQVNDQGGGLTVKTPGSVDMGFSKKSSELYSKKQDLELSMLVRSLKRKVGAKV